MRHSALLVSAVALLASASSLSGQAPSPGWQPNPLRREAPYRIGRVFANQELERGFQSLALAHPAPAARPLEPGARADGASPPDLACPMPVSGASGDTIEMPRASPDSIAPAVPMPVASAGCVNPLATKRPRVP